MGRVSRDHRLRLTHLTAGKDGTLFVTIPDEV